MVDYCRPGRILLHTLRVIFIIGNTCILLLDSSVDKTSEMSFDSKQSRITFFSLDTNTLDPSNLAMAAFIFQILLRFIQLHKYIPRNIFSFPMV